MQKAVLGNAMPEYVLIGSLVGIVAIGGFLSVGNSVDDWLSALRGDMNEKNTIALAAKTSREAEKVQAEKELAERTAAEKAKLDSTTKVCLTEASCISAPEQTQPTTPVQTTGGNGSSQTASQASQLKQLAIDYASMPGASPEILNYFQKLANTAYDLSANQYGLESDTAKDGYKLVTATAAKYNLVLWDNYASAKSAKYFIDLLKNPDSWLSKKMQKAGAARPTPEMFAQVDRAYTQISDSAMQYYKYANFTANSGDNTGGVVAQNYLDRIQGTDRGDKADNSFLKHGESKTTNKNADTVCDTGGGDCDRVTLP